ncbi:hypothetical protein [Marinimicrobium locisalis]|uniref:hypothetical protein n=1 Tax=Marinimicrobium locisalis TaxID=546022 RepID=UPI00322181E6
MRYIYLSLLTLICQPAFSESFEVTESERLGFYEERGFSLIRHGGEIIGYKITDISKYYKAVGLKRGVIVTRINGHDLSKIEGVRSSIESMKSAEIVEYRYIEKLGGEELSAVFEFIVKTEDDEEKKKKKKKEKEKDA